MPETTSSTLNTKNKSIKTIKAIYSRQANLNKLYSKNNNNTTVAYVCSEQIFDFPTVHEQQNIFEKTLKEVGSSHLYTSFGSFCFQIGQFLESLKNF